MYTDFSCLPKGCLMELLCTAGLLFPLTLVRAFWSGRNVKFLALGFCTKATMAERVNSTPGPGSLNRVELALGGCVSVTKILLLEYMGNFRFSRRPKRGCFGLHEKGRCCPHSCIRCWKIQYVSTTGRLVEELIVEPGVARVYVYYVPNGMMTSEK